MLFSSDGDVLHGLLIQFILFSRYVYADKMFTIAYL